MRGAFIGMGRYSYLLVVIDQVDIKGITLVSSPALFTHTQLRGGHHPVAVRATTRVPGKPG